MDDDDEFGDLYTDVLCPLPAHPQPAALGSSPTAAPPPAASKPVAVASNSLFGSDDDEDDGEIFHGAATSPRPASPAAPSPAPAQSVVPRPQEGGGEDWMLGEAPAPDEQPADWNEEEDGGLGRVSSSQDADLPTEPEEFRVSLEEDDEEEEGEVVTGVPEGRLQEAEGAERGIVSPGGASVPAVGRNAMDAMETDDGIGDLDQEPVIPGLSSASAASNAFPGVNGGAEKASRSDDLDSDSEDDLQIVLNDDNLGHFGANRNRSVGVEDEDDEDGEEDLVIVTDEDQHHHHHQVMEEQEWGDELTQQGLDGENNEGPDSKGNGGIGGRIAYGSHGFHGQHHSQYKYIRPGATAMTGGAAVGSGPPPGQVRPLTMGPIVGRPRGLQKGFHGYGLSAWGSGASARAYGSGLEFTLPSHKTIFDVDIDGFEEKPWRLPGIDTSDFFNFGLDEDSWRDYRKQLEQLRLEATMQSKIRVYESGRSEQDYDPDLPPELAAATGVQDIYAGSGQLGKADGGQTDLIGAGRGAMRAQQQLPTGRAIQVESGYGERLPSIDTRPPRIRDSDAIIEIVLQDSFDDSITSNGALDQRPYERERQESRGDHKVEDYDRGADSEHFNRSPSYSGRKKEVKKGPSMGSVDSNIMEGNGILPSPSDVSLQYRSKSKSHSPIYAGDHYGASRAARWTKESSRERHSHANDQHPNDATVRQSDKLQKDDDQKEKSEARVEGKDISQMSPTAPPETSREVTLEQGGSEQDDHPALDDVTEIEDKETASTLPLSDETQGDIDSYHAVKKQKLTSRVEQPAFQGDGVDSRVTQSDNSKAKAGSSKDYPKRREGGEEEVMQRGRSKQIGDVERHHDEEKRSSSQRRDEHGRDGTHETERSRISSKGREDIPQSQQHPELRPAHYERRSEGFERVKERDGSVGGRQRREDDGYGRRGKDEDMKRDQDKEIELRHKNKVMGAEKKGKDEDLHSRRHIDEDWKGHHYKDGTARQRDRDDSLMTRREPLDDPHVKRRKDEEQRRREKVSKEDSQHGYRGREDGSHGKKERDEGTDHRRREDQARVKDKAENHHSIRHRDDSWRQREREERLRFKQPREDTQKHKEREEGRSVVRTSRVLEDKTSGGSRASDVYPSKDRRRHGEQHRRVDRGEHTRAEHEAHEEMHTRDHQSSRKEKNSRHERLGSHIDHSLTASDGEKMHRERSRKGKEIEVRAPNVTTGKRKLENNSSNQNEKVGMNGTNDRGGNNVSYGLHPEKGYQLTDEPPDVQGQNHSENHVEENAVSDDEDRVRRGRSKLERWTSHKERDYSNSSAHSLSSSSRVGEAEADNDDILQHDDLMKIEDNHILDSDIKGSEVTQVPDLIGKESDRHLDTVAKLKKRSERFKLPMPGEKETATTKKAENETSLVQSETAADADIKHERPARKRRWSSS